MTLIKFLQLSGLGLDIIGCLYLAWEVDISHRFDILKDKSDSIARPDFEKMKEELSNTIFTLQEFLDTKKKNGQPTWKIHIAEAIILLKKSLGNKKIERERRSYKERLLFSQESNPDVMISRRLKMIKGIMFIIGGFILQFIASILS